MSAPGAAERAEIARIAAAHGLAAESAPQEPQAAPDAPVILVDAVTLAEAEIARRAALP